MKYHFKNTEEFINHLRANGRYAFSWEELNYAFPQSEKALKQSLYRLKTKGMIASIRSGFYAIIPPEYATMKMIPAELFIDDMMRVLGRNYYMGLFSAASLQGASHHAVMKYHIIIEPPALRQINNEQLSILFFVKKNWPEHLVEQRKTDAGYINISTSELTVLDLLSYGNFSINRVATIIKELSETIKINRLKKAVRVAQTATIQRLGYILDKVLTHNTFSRVLQKELLTRNVFPTPLVKGYHKKGSTDPFWKVIENTDIEPDL